MKFLSSLDAADRKLLLWSVGIALVLAVAIGLLMPSSNNNDNPLPSTYLAGQHGARRRMRRCCDRIIQSSGGAAAQRTCRAGRAANSGDLCAAIYARDDRHQGGETDCGARRARAGDGADGRIHPSRRGERAARRLHLCRLSTGAGWADAAGEHGRGVDGAGGDLAGGQSGAAGGLQLCRTADRGGI